MSQSQTLVLDRACRTNQADVEVLVGWKPDRGAGSEESGAKYPYLRRAAPATSEWAAIRQRSCPGAPMGQGSFRAQVRSLLFSKRNVAPQIAPGQRWLGQVMLAARSSRRFMIRLRSLLR